MKIIRKITLCFVLSATLALSFQWSVNAAEKLKLPSPEITKLKNGLTVAWFVNDQLPVVDMAVLIESGYRHDPAGKSGTAALTSALLDRGAAGMSPMEYASAFENLGASRYASADDDTFTVGVHGLAPDAEKLLALLAKTVTRPDFLKEEFEREKGRLLNRWQHIRDNAGTLSSLAFHRLLMAGTPYGRGSFLSVDEFKKVKHEDVKAFHARHFIPSNAVLMVVGRVDRGKFEKKIEKAFENWKGESAERSSTPFTDSRLAGKQAKIVVVDRPGVNQARVVIGFQAPGVKSPDFYPLIVLNALTGEYFNSRLNSVIRDQLGLTYSIGSSYAQSRDFSSIAIASATRSEQSGELIRRTLAILREIRDGKISEDEVRTAKEYLTGSFPLQVSTIGAVASRWLAGYIYDLGPGFLNEFIPKVRSVKREQVLKSAKQNLKPDQAVIVVAGDAGEIEKSLKAAGLKFTRVKVKQLL